MSDVSDEELAAVLVHPDTAREQRIQFTALAATGVRVIESAKVPAGTIVRVSRQEMLDALDRRAAREKASK
jgi:hypothetical protein